MPEPSPSLKWPLGREALACRVGDWCVLPWTMCFASETRRKVDTLGLELVRCLWYSGVRPLANRSFEKKAKESCMLEKTELDCILRDGQFIKCSPVCQAPHVIWTLGLFVSLPQPEEGLPGGRARVCLGLIHPITSVLGTEQALSQCWIEKYINEWTTEF